MDADAVDVEQAEAGRDVTMPRRIPRSSRYASALRSATGLRQGGKKILEDPHLRDALLPRLEGDPASGAIDSHVLDLRGHGQSGPLRLAAGNRNAPQLV